MLEHEVKLSAAEDFKLPDLSGLLGGVVPADRPDEQLSTLYLDSDDFRLARWDVSFRHREGQGWTVKIPGRSAGALLVRDEIVFPGSSQHPPPEAVSLVRGYLRRAELRPQVRLQTLRRGVRLLDAEGRLLADVVDDAVSVVDGPQGASSFRQLEVETTPDTPPGLLEAVVARLRDHGAGEPDPTPKYLRALGGLDAAPPELALSAPRASASLGEVVTHTIATGVTQLLRYDPVVRLDTGDEGVHKARVATRQMRSDLRTLHVALDPQWTAERREELGWLGRELGAARDADVLLERLRARADALPEASAAGAHLVIEALEHSRRDAHAALLNTLGSDRYLDLIDRLIEAAQAPALLQPIADRAAAKELPRLVRRSWRRLDRAVAALDDPPTNEGLHAVRIRAKRCRYAAEACAPALGKRTRKLARAAARLQNVLGELNDAVVAERWLRQWAAGTSSSSGAFAAGELAALERDAGRQARTRWPKAWKRTSASGVRLAK